MSIIFQLFSAEDLRKLNKDELKHLRDEILEALKNADVLKADGKLHLNLKEKVGPNQESPRDLQSQPPWVVEALLKRFYEVSHQLKTPPHDPSQQSFNFDTLITERNDTAAEELILKWAISCELNHIEFYYALIVARQGVENFYKKYPDIKIKLLTEEKQREIETLRSKLQRTEEQQQAINNMLEEFRAKEPDSGYSPFNPRHPLYGHYYKA